MPLRDGLDAAHYLPLGDRVDGIDVVQPGLAVVVALVHCVYPKIARPAAWIWFAPLGNGHLPRLGVLDTHALAAVNRRVAQVINVEHRDARQPLILRLAEHFMLPFYNSPHRRSGQVFMCRVHSRQKSDVGRRVPSWKTWPTNRLALNTPRLHPTTDPSRQLRSAQSSHLHKKTAHDSFLATA